MCGSSGPSRFEAQCKGKAGPTKASEPQGGDGLGGLDNGGLFGDGAKNESARIGHMRNGLRVVLALGVSCFFLAGFLAAQGGTGAISLSARVAATGAQPESVRQFPLYVLTKSYADVVKEVEGQDALPTRDKFIDGLTVTPELKAWLKAHDLIDLTSPDLDKVLTPEDIMKVPEFFAAYERSNAGGVTKGFPLPKYREADKEANPDRYQKQKEEFLTATKKFMETHPSSVQGIELELTGVNPKVPWDDMQAKHKNKVAQFAPDTAQLKYMAAKVLTDLDGHALISGLPAGNYWVSSLGMDATSGDRRLSWDVPVNVQAGQTIHLDLSNLNATDTRRNTSTPGPPGP
jgi:hypothetical protein